MQEGKEAKARVPSSDIYNEVGVKVREQEQEGSGAILLALVGWSKVVEEDDTESADELGELEGQAAVPVAQFAPASGG
jgi:formylmethanofuran dehydrogenase subunit D